jgi:glyoxylase-like metal-dependent hydrolase (beta-lactamase superfamily II)
VSARVRRTASAPPRRRDLGGHVDELGADWVAITHAHPDHAFGLRVGVAAPVYATRATSETLERFPVADLRTATPSVRFALGPFASRPTP